MGPRLLISLALAFSISSLSVSHAILEGSEGNQAVGKKEEVSKGTRGYDRSNVEKEWGATDPRLLADEVTFPTKDPPVGIYCDVGRGMTRSINNMLDGTMPDPKTLKDGNDQITLEVMSVR